MCYLSNHLILYVPTICLKWNILVSDIPVQHPTHNMIIINYSIFYKYNSFCYFMSICKIQFPMKKSTYAVHMIIVIPEYLDNTYMKRC